MESTGEKEWSSGFGFNEVDFSDRVLRLEIAPTLPPNTIEDSKTSEFGSTTGLKLKKIHVNSLVLASRSKFFYKLLFNGMKETQQRYEVALKIDESEEAALMDLLKFMYGIPITASSAQDLVDVLMVADKFEVPSCISKCADLLLKLPMSTELALLCICLPSTLKADEVFETLIESGKKCLCAHYMDFTQSKEEAMGLPLCAVQVLLGSDGLQVDLEDTLLNFILKWGRLHYPELEKRQVILTGLLLNSICLPELSKFKLKEVADCSDFDTEKVMKPVLNALFAKDQDLALLAATTTNHEHPRRVYTLKLVVKVVQLQLASPRCLVYFDLTKDECADLSNGLLSEVFCLGGIYVWMLILAEKLSTVGFDLCLICSRTCKLGIDTSVMKKSSKDFTSLVQTTARVSQARRTATARIGRKMPWTEMLNEEGEYFMDGILHFRVDFTLIS